MVESFLSLFENWTGEFAGGVALGFVAGLTFGSWLYFGREFWRQKKDDTDLADRVDG